MHIENLKKKFGEFSYAPYRIPLDPSAELEQLKLLLPKYNPNEKILQKFSINYINKNDEGELHAKKPKLDTSNSDDECSIKKSIVKNVEPNVEVLSPKLITEISNTSNEGEKNKLTRKELVHCENTNKLNLSLKSISISDFDKFMEGYGTEDDELIATELNAEVRKNFSCGTSEYGSDSEDSYFQLNSSGSIDKDVKNCDEEYDQDKISVSSSDASGLNRGKVRTRGGYHNVSGKIKILRRKSYESERTLYDTPKANSENYRKTSEINSPNYIDQRLEFEKVNKVCEFSENLEISLNTPDTSGSCQSGSNDFTLCSEKITQDHNKTVDNEELHNRDKELQLVCLDKTETITDKLMKRMSLTLNDEDVNKVETVKKQILDKLEATSSNTESHNEELIHNTEKKQNINIDNFEKNSSILETQLVAADSQSLSSNEDSNDEDYLHLTTVKKSCISSGKNIISRIMKKSHSNNVSQVPEKININPETVSQNNVIPKKNSDLNKLKNDTNFKLKTSRVELKKNQQETITVTELQIDQNKERENVQLTPELQKKYLKIVNVGDIISGRIDSTSSGANIVIKKVDKKIEDKNSSDTEIKLEPISDSEDTNSTQKIKLNNSFPSDKIKEKLVENTFEKKVKVVDNVTKIIEAVSSNYHNSNDNGVRPCIKRQSPKQKARKTFPISSINKLLQPVHVTTTTQEKKDLVITSNASSLTKISNSAHLKTHQLASDIVSTTSTLNKAATDSLLYINQTQAVQNSVVLPPNQPISLAQNVANPILTMVPHPSLSNASLIIQHSTPSVAVPFTVQTQAKSICTESIGINHGTQGTVDNITDDLSKALGDIMCNKLPPKLKPKPPGPLSQHFDEGNPSSAGPVTKIINSVAHRLTDYFRGLIQETLSDLSDLNSPEAKIRSLELEIENLKHKHTEEMLEYRKNISTILKEIQKSITEEKNKIIDDTRTICEAERLRSVEEAKSKQW